MLLIRRHNLIFGLFAAVVGLFTGYFYRESRIPYENRYQKRDFTDVKSVVSQKTVPSPVASQSTGEGHGGSTKDASISDLERANADLEKNGYISDSGILNEQLAVKYGSRKFTDLAKVVGPFLSKWEAHAKKIAEIVENPVEGIRIWVPPTVTMEQAQIERKNLLEKLDGILGKKDSQEFYGYVTGNLSLKSGFFGSRGRLLVAKASLGTSIEKEGEQNLYTFIEYEIDAERTTNGSVNVATVPAGQPDKAGVPLFYTNSRTIRSSQIPRTFEPFFSYVDEGISAVGLSK